MKEMRVPWRTVLALTIVLVLVHGVRLIYAALPMSRSTTYVAGSPPPIKAQDLNDLQDFIGRMYSGTRSIVSLTADGSGNAVVTPPAGVLRAARTVAQTSLPTTLPIVAGEVNAESVPVGMASMASGCLVNGAANVVSATPVSTGVCTMVFNFVPPGNDPTRALVQITERNVSNYTCRASTALVDGSNRLKITVGCVDTTNTPQDSAFYIAVSSL